MRHHNSERESGCELHHGQGPGKYRQRLTPSAQDHLIFLTGHQAGIPSKTPLRNTKTATTPALCPLMTTIQERLCQSL
jgi:hypothetical protein